MIHLRRRAELPRLEMMPLIDVIFLLITFFIYALVLMVRADLLPVTLPKLVSGEPARNVVPIVVLLDGEGRLYVNAEAAPDTAAVLERVTELREEDAERPIFLAADQKGEKDRLPLFFNLVDQMRQAGIGDFSIMGAAQPNNSEE